MGLDPGFNPFDPGDPGGVFDGIVAEILAALEWLYNALVAVILWVWNLLVAIVQFLLTVFKTIAKFLVTVWNDYIKKGILWLADHIQKLRAWLKRTLDPVIKFFQKLKHWYDTHILAQQLRLLKMLQAIRRFLAIFRIFGFKWAAALDNALADIQQRIEQSIAFVRGILNQIINTLALVLDPTLFIARNVIGGTLLGNLGALKRIFGYGDNRILSASEQATIDKQHSLYFASTVKDHLTTLNATGPTQDDQDNRTAARQALADATNTTLPF